MLLTNKVYDNIIYNIPTTVGDTLTVTFFGHRNAPYGIKEKIKIAIINELKNGATNFLVGNNGNFDNMCISLLSELSKEYDFNWEIVLAYMPNEKNDITNFNNTLLPAEIETAPPKFAICRRNEWMIKNSNTVVCYITHEFGGAATYVELAKRKKKKIVYIK